MRDPYFYLPKRFAEAVARGLLHVYCEFCAARTDEGCAAGVADPVAAWRGGECPRYAEAADEDRPRRRARGGGAACGSAAS